MTWTIHNGDCLEVLRTLADCSVDAVVTDPPYGLSFMGKRWDYDVPSVDVWAECLRVLKPGGHLLAFAGTRTQHRMAVRIEDAGFEIRDMIAWVYGSGFPKSLDVSKAIDKAAGAEREVVGVEMRFNEPNGIVSAGRDERTLIERKLTAPATDAARQWQGWGTALKPALEPITVARKPLVGTVAENVLTHGTGGLNVDGCRVACFGESLRGGAKDGSSANKVHEGWDRPWKNDPEKRREAKIRSEANQDRAELLGRWPANLIHDGSEEPTNLLGDAARFFYCPKASKADRDEGCETMEAKAVVRMATQNGASGVPSRAMERFAAVSRNHHPTVKPTDLMCYLCRLVTPPSGVVLDPFTGSGSTGKAAILERFSFIGIEREAEYCEIARARISKAEREIMGQFNLG